MRALPGYCLALSPEFELLYISQSTGTRFVGDSVSRFYPGDLVLVGPYLPHLWRNDPNYYDLYDTNKVNTIILKFTLNFIGEGTFNIPEFSQIKDLLNQSKFGINFNRKISQELHEDLLNISDLPIAMQSIKLLDILYRLALSKNKKILSSTDMRQYSNNNSQRIDRVLKYISDHYASDISLQDVADIACLTTNSFCRFFKKND